MAFFHKYFDVGMRHKINTSALFWPEPGAASGQSCLGCNRAYQDLRRLPSSEAKHVIALEQELVAAIEAAEYPEEAYDAIEEELYEDPDGIYGLDLGVAGAVIALSAGRRIPFSSCNAGAFDAHHHEVYPVIAFYARPRIRRAPGRRRSPRHPAP